MLPVFLEHERYIEVPFEDICRQAGQGVPTALRPI